MKATELMVGDWVKLDFYDNAYANKEDAVWKNGKITAIHHGNWVDIDFGGVLNECDILVGDIQPIPLTPEILEKNGFEKKTFYGIYDDYFDFYIREYSDGLYIVTYHSCEFNIPDQTIHVSWVHELQNFMKHCGIEKDIVL